MALCLSSNVCPFTLSNHKGCLHVWLLIFFEQAMTLHYKKANITEGHFKLMKPLGQTVPQDGTWSLSHAKSQLTRVLPHYRKTLAKKPAAWGVVACSLMRMPWIWNEMFPKTRLHQSSGDAGFREDMCHSCDDFTHMKLQTQHFSAVCSNGVRAFSPKPWKHLLSNTLVLIRTIAFITLRVTQEASCWNITFLNTVLLTKNKT